MTFVRFRPNVRFYAKRRIVGQLAFTALVSAVLLLTSVGNSSPSSVYAAESQPTTVRSDRRADRERTTKVTPCKHISDENDSRATSPRRPRAIRC